MGDFIQVEPNEKMNCISDIGLVGHGNQSARIMIITDNLSEEEYNSERLFRTRAYNLLETLCSNFKIPLDECYMTSLVKSPMPLTDKQVQMDVAKTDIDVWLPVFEAEMDLVDPDIIIPMGNAALKQTYGTTGITKLRGNAIEREYKGRKRIIFPTLHPETVFRQPKYSDMYVSDFNSLGTVCAEGFDYLTADKVDYRYLETLDEVKEEIGRLHEAEWVCFDLETTGLNPFRDTSKIGCVSLTDRTRYGVTIPIEHPDFVWPGVELQQVVSLVKGLYENKAVKKMGHNVKFDMLWERAVHDVDVQSVEFDPQLAHYIAYNQDTGTHGLKQLAWEYTDMGGYDNELDNYKKEHNIKGNYNLIPWTILRRYAAADVDCTFRLFEKFKPVIDANPAYSALMDQYMKASYTIRNMEYNGAYLNMDRLEYFNKVYELEIEKLEKKLQSYPEVLAIEREKEDMFRRRQIEMKKPKAERDPEIVKWIKFKNFKFSFNSVPQLRELLFNRLGLETPYKTDSGAFSTGAESLEYMSDQHPIVDMLTRLRKLTKLYGTYITPAFEWADSESIIHPTFNLTGCVAPGTNVLTEDGYRPMYEIIDCDDLDSPGEMVPLLDKDVKVFDGELYRTPISGYYSGRVELVYLTHANNKNQTLLCTLMHRIATPDGWKHAGTLQRDDLVTVYDEKTGRYVDSPVTAVRDVYGPAFDLVMDEYDKRAYESNMLIMNNGDAVTPSAEEGE